MANQRVEYAPSDLAAVARLTELVSDLSAGMCWVDSFTIRHSNDYAVGTVKFSTGDDGPVAFLDAYGND